MRIEPPIRIDACIQQQTNIVCVCENPVHKRPTELAQFFFAFRVPENILAALAHRNIRVHPAAVHSYHRLRQEAGRKSHLRRHLPADQLIELNLICRRHHFSVPIINLKL